jgi:hypothetical protein
MDDAEEPSKGELNMRYNVINVTLSIIISMKYV